jgi:hypothetical protein
MKLRTFDLDLPLAQREVRRDFRRGTRWVCALYERCFDGIPASRGWKVLIRCVPEVTRTTPIDLLGVLCQELQFDITTFEALSGVDRAACAIETLQRGIRKVALAEGWPLEPFEIAKRRVIEKGYVNEWAWPKRPRISRDRSMLAQLHCQHQADAFRATLVVTTKTGQVLGRCAALQELPSEFAFVPRLGELVWTSDQRVVLLDKGGKEVVSFEIPR